MIILTHLSICELRFNDREKIYKYHEIFDQFYIACILCGSKNIYLESLFHLEKII